MFNAVSAILWAAMTRPRWWSMMRIPWCGQRQRSPSSLLALVAIMCIDHDARAATLLQWARQQTADLLHRRTLDFEQIWLRSLRSSQDRRGIPCWRQIHSANSIAWAEPQSLLTRAEWYHPRRYGSTMSKTMPDTCISALRISPKYTSNDWQALDQHTPTDWPKAVDIVKDRLDGRFLRFANNCLLDEYSGFVVLAIDCLLAETIQQFIDGIPDGDKQSGPLFRKFLQGPRFQPEFDEQARKDFYKDIRCGLLHQAEAKRMWLIRRQRTTLLEKSADGNGYILDVEHFHTRLRETLNDYLTSLCEPGNADLRSKLWIKMNHICSVRAARGALYAPEATGGS